MAEYVVSWSEEVDADSPQEAARLAAELFASGPPDEVHVMLTDEYSPDRWTVRLE